jgi:hypothetical protein
MPKAKLDLLWSAFVDDAMSPGMAVKKTGVSIATANRFHKKWGEKIREALNQQLLPRLEESLGQAHKLPKQKSKTRKKKPLVQ